MNLADYESFKLHTVAAARLSASMLRNRVPRTLIFGYDCARNTFHVYLGHDDKLHIVRYTSDEYLISHQDEEAAEPAAYVPDKRVYPGACDLEFCRILKDVDVDIPFTTFEERPDQAFHGKKREELIEVPASYTVPGVTIAFEDFDFPAHAPVMVYPHMRRDFEKVLPVSVAQVVDHFYKMVKFKRVDPEGLTDRVMRRLQGLGHDASGERFCREEDYRYRMSDKAVQTLVPRVMQVLRDAWQH